MKKRIKVEYRKVADLKPYAGNSRRHTPDQIAAIARLIEQVGWTKPIITRGADIAAGHGAYEAAKTMGLAEVPTINRADMTEEQFRAYVIADNRVAELSTWDSQALGFEFEWLTKAGADLDLTAFDKKARQAIGREAAKARSGLQNGSDDEDVIPEPPKRQAVAKLGDLWQLGPHRLIVGDSLKSETLNALTEGKPAHLIACDPPYAIYGSASGIASDITDDKIVRPFFERTLAIARDHLPFFAHAYFFCDWRSWPSIWEASKSVPEVVPKNCLVWDKKGAGLGANYANTHEFIGFFMKLPQQTAMRHREAGQRPVHKPNILRFNRVSGDERHHNAAKPVAMMRELIENSTQPGERVLDPFCGSGSTLVGAQQIGRVCLTSEIEPFNADITLRRFIKLFSEQPTLDGKPFEKVQAARARDVA